MFSSIRTIVSLPDISIWEVSKVTNMKAMFYGCQFLQSMPDILKWDVKKSY